MLAIPVAQRNPPLAAAAGNLTLIDARLSPRSSRYSQAQRCRSAGLARRCPRTHRGYAADPTRRTPPLELGPRAEARSRRIEPAPRRRGPDPARNFIASITAPPISARDTLRSLPDAYGKPNRAASESVGRNPVFGADQSTKPHRRQHDVPDPPVGIGRCVAASVPRPTSCSRSPRPDGRTSPACRSRRRLRAGPPRSRSRGRRSPASRSACPSGSAPAPGPHRRP